MLAFIGKVCLAGLPAELATANVLSTPRILRVNDMTSTAQSIASDSVITLDRRSAERRQASQPPVQEQRTEKKARRRHIDPTTCERDYRHDELDFMRAMDDYKRSSGRMFPTCSEVLEVVRSLGYVRLTDEQVELLGDTLEDQSGPNQDMSDDEESDFDLMD